ncbi:Mu-like prophage FluMu protein gp28, partial [Marinomonas sp. S3726]
ENLYKNAPNKESADEEYGCVPKKSGGTYLGRVLIEQAMVADHSIPIIRYEAPEDFMSWSVAVREAEMQTFCDENLSPLLEKLNPEERHTFGEDFARRGDLTVFTPLSIRSDLRKRAPFVVELRSLTYEQQAQVMMFIMRKLPRLSGAAFDATGNGGYLAEKAALEFGTDMVDQVMLSAGWYQEWMPKLKAEFESFNIEVPRHQNILDDLLQIKVVNGIPCIDKGRTKDEGASNAKSKRHGDFAVSLAMANRASYMDGGEIDFTPLPNRDSRWGEYSDDDDSYLDQIEGAY